MVLGLDTDLLTRSAIGLAAFAGTFRAGAALAVIDQPRLPPQKGFFEHVGVCYSRCGGARVKVFYPASAPSETAAACTPPETATLSYATQL